MASTPLQNDRHSSEYSTHAHPDSNPAASTRRSAEGDGFHKHQSQFRSSQDFSKPGASGYSNGDGALPMPNAPPPHIVNGGARHGGTMSLGGFEGSRSPPAAKNTSHVPCKFFRSGQCQAGRACPFSHSLEVSSVDTPCKYFAKGNCKFGQKCALAHVFPDGRRANRPSGNASSNVAMGPRMDPQVYQQPDPMLLQSLLAQQANGVPPPFNHQIPTFVEHEPPVQDGHQLRPYDQVPPRDFGYGAYPDSKYGSPREDSRFLSLSPSARLSVLDAPLPASFDSQGISYMARHGPVAASLPSKIGVLESSPPASLPRKGPIPLDSISNLGSSGFAGRDSRNRGQELGSSPFGSGDESFGPRFMHSGRQPKSKLLSTSMPRVDVPIEDSDDDAFHFSGGEEDYIPTSIHDQVLTRDEQQRRNSRTEHDRRTIQESLSGVGTPNESSSKVGSPTTGSPSRYGPLFARQTQQQQENNSNLATSPSAFGHIGSPLRNSSLQPGGSPSLRANRVAGDISPSFPSLSSPPRQSSMSVLSQQLSRTRLSSKTSEANNAASQTAVDRSSSNINNNAYTSSGNTDSAGGSRAVSSPTTPSAGGGGVGYRNMSGGSQHSQGRSTDRIEEEQVDTVFSMEDDFDEHRRRTAGQVPPPPSSTSMAAPAPAWSQIAAKGVQNSRTAAPGLARR